MRFLRALRVPLPTIFQRKQVPLPDGRFWEMKEPPEIVTLDGLARYVRLQYDPGELKAITDNSPRRLKMKYGP